MHISTIEGCIGILIENFLIIKNFWTPKKDSFC